MMMRVLPWLVALALLALGTQTALASSRLSGAVASQQTYANDAANTTMTLVSARDGQTLRALGLMLSVDTSDTIKLSCGSQTRAAFFLGARSGLAQTFFPLTLACRGQSALLAGTIAVTSGSSAISGTGTAFTQDFATGDRVVVNGTQVLTIQSVGSATAMTATANATTTQSGVTYRRGADNLTLVKGNASTAVHASLWYEQEP